MKKTLLLILSLGSLTGCQHVASALHATVIQQLDVDTKTSLTVRVEGAETRLVGVPASAPGEPIHRVLQSSDGTVLFAYDLEVGKGSMEGVYRFRLKPSQQKPTFAAAREVTVIAPQDSVRVELMERPGTGEKVVDVFSLRPRSAQDADVLSPTAHLKRLHSMAFHFFHDR